jgi:hypothetical protein
MGTIFRSNNIINSLILLAVQRGALQTILQAGEVLAVCASLFLASQNPPSPSLIITLSSVPSVPAQFISYPSTSSYPASTVQG